MTSSQPPPKGTTEQPTDPDFEGNTLAEEVSRIRDEFEKSQEELAKIVSASAGQVPAADLVRRRRELEERAGSLLVRYVIGQRLTSSPEFSGVMRALEEVLEGMVGLARFEVYWKGGERQDFVLCMAFPDKEDELGHTTLSSSTIAKAAERGQRLVLTYDEQKRAGPGAPLCWFPMRAGDEPLGGIAVFEVLPHKKYLGPSDLELLEMISDHAADAIAAADAYSRRKFNLKTFHEVITHGKQPPRA